MDLEEPAESGLSAVEIAANEIAATAGDDEHPTLANRSSTNDNIVMEPIMEDGTSGNDGVAANNHQNMEAFVGNDGVAANNHQNMEAFVAQLNNEVSALIHEIQEVHEIAGGLIDDDVYEFYGFPDAEIANAIGENDEEAVAMGDNNHGGNNEATSNAPLGENVGFSNSNDVVQNAITDDGGTEGDSNSTTNSNMSLADTDSDEEVQANPPSRWLIPQHHVNEAISELISQARLSEGGIAGLLHRENFMQRVRSTIFSLERNRNRRRRSANIDENTDDSNESISNEHINEALQSQSMNDNNEDDDNEHLIRFDTNLPAEHSYFGTNLNRVPGVNYLEVGARYRMLIFMHQHLLFPGEVLPFMINGNIIEEEAERASAWTGQEGIIFGVVFPFLHEVGGNPQKFYGVTCQIYERGESGREMVFFKSRALQRFVADCHDLHGPPQYIASNPRVKCYGVARILPEIYLPEPLKCINMGAMNRYRNDEHLREKFKRFQITTTPLPAFAYNEYSITDTIEKARRQLEKHKIDTMPTCPIQLSFWLVRNLHLTEKLMNKIFMTDSVNIRLKIIGLTFKGTSLFLCRYCNNSIANCDELFAMSKHGVQTQYCNSAGYIHETNTVYRLLPDSVTYSGEPSTEFSWFPGYQWHIMICKFCSHHIGWEYMAVKPNLVPKKFFGLAGSNVLISKVVNVPSNNRRPFIYSNLLNMF